MSALQSPFPEYEHEIQTPAEFDIFWGAIDSLSDNQYNGHLFRVSMSDVSINYVPHLIENVTIMTGNVETCEAAIDLLSRYTHQKATNGSAGITGLTDYAPIQLKADYRQALGTAPSTPATFAVMTLGSIDAYRGKITDWSVQQNATAWRAVTSTALKRIDLEILDAFVQQSE